MMGENRRGSRALLAEAVKEALHQRNWKQTDLAQAAGISQSTVSNVVRGRTDTAPATLRRLANAFGWDESVLSRVFYGEIEDERRLIIEQIGHMLRPWSAAELLQAKRILDELDTLRTLRQATDE